MRKILLLAIFAVITFNIQAQTIEKQQLVYNLDKITVQKIGPWITETSNVNYPTIYESCQAKETRQAVILASQPVNCTITYTIFSCNLATYECGECGAVYYWKLRYKIECDTAKETTPVKKE